MLNPVRKFVLHYSPELCYAFGLEPSYLVNSNQLCLVVKLHSLVYLVCLALNDGWNLQEKQRKWAEEQSNLYQQQAQGKAQIMRYEDELTRKRMQVWTIPIFFNDFLFEYEYMMEIYETERSILVK